MNRPGNVTEPPDRAEAEPLPSQPLLRDASPAAEPLRARRLQKPEGEPTKARRRGLQKPEDIPTRLVPPRPAVKTEVAQPPPPWDFLRILANLVQWVIRALLLRLAHRFDAAESAARLRALLEQIGGLCVKTGQLLAMRRDLFSDAFCDELAKLQDRAGGFAPKQVRRIVEEDLGGPIEEFFETFDPTPFAAASIGQIHDARLRSNGVRVAVKVQRPHIRERFARDLLVIRAILWTFSQLRYMTHLRWGELLWELEGTLNDELDYRLEATSIRRMRRSLKSHKIYVPKVFAKYCTARVLVMEFVQGVFVSDYIHVATNEPEKLPAWEKENRIKPPAVGRKLFFSHMRQVLEDNLFHCDLHPGNILLTRNNGLVLIDFGAIGSLENGLVHKYGIFFSALAQRQYSKIADMMMLMGPPLPATLDSEEVKADIVRWMRRWEVRVETKNLPFYEKSFSFCVTGITRIMMKYKMPATWEFLRMNRAGVTVESSIAFLLPRANFIALAAGYQETAENRAVKKAADPRFGLRRVAAGVRNAVEMPQTLSENIFFEGEWLRRRAKVFQTTTSKLAYLATGVANLLRAMMFAVTLIAANITMYALDGGWHARWLGARVGGAVTDLLDRMPRYAVPLSLLVLPTGLYLWLFASRMGRRFAQKEVTRSFEQSR